jgi:hypothetical protein
MQVLSASSCRSSRCRFHVTPLTDCSTEERLQKLAAQSVIFEQQLEVEVRKQEVTKTA